MQDVTVKQTAVCPAGAKTKDMNDITGSPFGLPLKHFYIDIFQYIELTEAFYEQEKQWHQYVSEVSFHLGHSLYGSRNPDRKIFSSDT